MAATAVLPAMNHDVQNTLHPFFGSREQHRGAGATEPWTSHNSGARDTSNDDYSGELHCPDFNNAAPTIKACRKEHTQASNFHNEPQNDPRIDLLGQQQQNTAIPEATRADTVKTSVLMSQWPISSKAVAHPRKKRKVGQSETQIMDDTATKTLSDESRSAEPVSTASAVQEQIQPTTFHDTIAGPSVPAPRTPPKKMLKLGRSGKLGSPPINPTATLDISPAKARKRGRPRKEVVKQSKIAILRYSAEAALSNDSVAQRITRVLAGTERYERASIKAHAPSLRLNGPPKSTHPFFGGKPLAKPDRGNLENAPQAVEQRSPRKSSAATPGKIRRQMQEIRSTKSACVAEPTDSRAKHNSLKLETWPFIGALHVRGQCEHIASHSSMSLQRRKQKERQAPAIDRLDTVLQNRTATKLHQYHAEGRLRHDGFRDPHPVLRVPTKRLLSGRGIMQAVIPHLNGRLGHPALSNLQRSVATHMTAWDHGRGEQLPWAQKYAPVTAACVLQVGNEALILRDWMKALTVLSTTMSSAPLTTKMAETKVRKKRRKKDDDLDEFIVASGDEADVPAPLNDLEELSSQGSRGDGVGKSMIRPVLISAQSDARKIANTIVLSGPHGCGKTAMVQAVAKELDFQIFEVNPGSRRSGRDILERIGDVLGNHIVSHDAPDPGNLSADEDASRHAAALQKDLESGRQGTMNSFFGASTTKVVKKAPVAKQAPVVQAAKVPTRRQKQSIILLEEVDVLFEEDKAFWTTVLSIISTSRRPVVMTCTNEASLPLDDWLLHALLRLDPAPLDLAADYLLLMAAQEGHLLDRNSLTSLYDYKKHDLRASITELQFWCQMGIGDPRGGLDWIFQRYPAGTGVDENGDIQRVVSDGTYHTGLGMLSFERVVTDEIGKQQELSLEAWSDFGVDPRDDAHLRIAESPDLAGTNANDASSRLRALGSMERLADTLSTLALLPSFALSSRHSANRYGPLGWDMMEPLDASVPSMTAKARASYTEYPRLVQADLRTEPDKLTADLTVTATQLVRAIHRLPPKSASQLHDAIRNPPPPSVMPLGPTTFYTALDPLSYPIVTPSQQQTATGFTFLLSPLSPCISLEMAPYVRQIVAHDLKLDEERRKLHEALHGETGGQGQGKMRRTRAARGALEGKGRSGVRRERWWDVEIDTRLVARSGGVGWEDTWGREMEGRRAVRAQEEEERERQREEEEVRVRGGGDREALGQGGVMLVDVGDGLVNEG